MKIRALYGLVNIFWVLTLAVIPSLAAGVILCTGGIASTVALITHEAKRNSERGFQKGVQHQRELGMVAPDEWERIADAFAQADAFPDLIDAQSTLFHARADYEKAVASKYGPKDQS